MKKTTFLLMAMAAMLLSSCSTVRYYADDLKANPRTDIPVLEPYTSLTYRTTKREAGKAIPMGDSLMHCAYDQMMQTLLNDPELPIGDVIYVDNDTVRDLIDYAMNRIAWSIPNKEVASEVALPDVLQHFMEDNDLPYLMLIFQEGYDSTTRKVFSDAGKSLGIALCSVVASLGTFAIIPPIYDCESYIALLIADRDRGALAYYNRVGSLDRPSSQRVLSRELKQLLKHYPEK